MIKKELQEKTHLEIEQELAKDLKETAKALKQIRNLELIQVIKNPGRMMWLALIKGIMIGFGSVIGATVLVAIFVYLLAQIKLVPIVGNFIESVLEEVQIPMTAEELKKPDIGAIYSEERMQEPNNN